MMAEELRKNVAATVAMPNLQLDPNFEQLWSTLLAEQAAGQNICDDWVVNLGAAAKSYFEELAHSFKSAGIADDDLLPQAFAEVVLEKNHPPGRRRSQEQSAPPRSISPTDRCTSSSSPSRPGGFNLSGRLFASGRACHILPECSPLTHFDYDSLEPPPR